MASLPDASTLGLPTPQPNQGVASYQAHTRMEGEAAQYEQQAGSELQQAGNILKDYQDKQDSVVALNAVNRLKEASLNLAQDPDNGFQNVKGNAVVGQPFVKQYQDRFAQQQSSIANSLANDNQRRLFAQHAEVVGLGYQSDLYHHQAKETKVFNDQTRNDTIDLALKDVAAHPYDDQTYDKNVAIAGQTVVAQGKDMGLTGQALADYTKSTLSSLNSKALAYRTQAMAEDNPMVASDFFHKHELEFDPQTRLTLGQHLKTTTDAQVTHLMGQKIVEEHVAGITGANAPPTPINYGADFVKPFQQTQMSQYVDAVKKPSAYDKQINEAAAKYNVSPTELKLRAIIESSMNPNADNGKASGLMGFTPETAKQYGIDPKDPAQAIDGAARLMAAAGGTLGGDMSKVDRAYYGGNANATGKNTDQYVENMRAIRSQLYGGNTPKPLTLADIESSEGDIIKKAQAAAENYRPGDAVLKDQFVADALKNLNQKKQIIQNQNNAAVQTVLGEVQNGASSVSTLTPEGQKAYSSLPPATQMQIDAKLKKIDNDPSFGAERYYTLSSMAANPETRAQFQNLDLTKELGGVSTHYWNQLVNIQNSMTKQDAKQLDKDMNFSKMQRDTSIMLKPYLDSLGKNKQLVDDTKSQFYGRLQEAEQQFRDDPKNGRWPTTPERQKIAASLLTQVTTPSGHWFGWGDKTTPAFQANNLDGVTVQINKADKPVLQKTFQDVNGRVPTDDELTQWHTQLQQQAYKSTGQYLPARDLANLYTQYAARQKAKQPQSQANQIPK